MFTRSDCLVGQAQIWLPRWARYARLETWTTVVEGRCGFNILRYAGVLRSSKAAGWDVQKRKDGVYFYCLTMSQLMLLSRPSAFMAKAHIFKDNLLVPLYFSLDNPQTLFRPFLLLGVTNMSLTTAIIHCSTSSMQLHCTL